MTEITLTANELIAVYRDCGEEAFQLCVSDIQIEYLDISVFQELEPKLLPLLPLTMEDWVYTLMKKPECSKYFDWGTFEELDSYEWAGLINVQPQFAHRCNWKKLKASHSCDIIVRHPQLSQYCDFSKFFHDATYAILYLHPILVSKFTTKQLKTLNKQLWTRLIEKNPQLATMQK